MIPIGIVGLGSIGQAKLDYLLSDPKFQVVGIVDPRLSSHDSVPVLASIQELVETAGAVLVDISSPPMYHFRNIMDALAVGAHVACEKPLTLSVPLVREVQHAAANTARMVYPVRNYLFSPDYLLLQKLVNLGSLGELRTVTFEIDRPSHAQGTLQWQPNWRLDSSIAGGGVLTDHGSHYLYIGPRLLNAPITSLSARVRTLLGGCETAAHVELNTASTQCRISLTWSARTRRNRWQVTGTLGRLLIENGRISSHPEELVSVTSLEPLIATSTHSSWFPAMYSDIADTLSDPSRFASNLEEGVRVVELLDRAYASAKLGGTEIKLNPRVYL